MDWRAGSDSDDNVSPGVEETATVTLSESTSLPMAEDRWLIDERADSTDDDVTSASFEDEAASG